MSLNFTIPELNIGGVGTPPLQFFKQGFALGGTGSGTQWEDIILSGNTALTLANSKANGLEYLKLFGDCEQRNIPTGYTQVDGVTNGSSGYIDTGVVANVDDVEYDLVARIESATTISWYIFQSRPAGAGDIYGISGSNSGNTIAGIFSGTSLTSSIARQQNHTYHINLKCKNGNATLFVEDLTASTSDLQNGTYTFSAATTNIGLFSNVSGGGVLSAGNTSVLSAYIKKSGAYVMNYISCKQDSTAGFYDSVSNSFVGASNGSLTAGNDYVVSPTTPMDIVCNNGAIKYSPNELNPKEIVIGYYIASSTGTLTESDYNFITGFMPVKPNQSYVFFGRRIEDNRLSSYNRIHWFDSNQEYISTNTYTKDAVGVGVAPANAVFAKCSCNESGATTRETTQAIVDGYNWVFELATAEVPYIPYVEGGLYIDGTTETVQVRGKNIANIEFTEVTMSGIKYTSENQVLTAKGTVSGSSYSNFSLTNYKGAASLALILTNSSGVTKFKAGKTYTVSFSNGSDIYDLRLVQSDLSASSAVTLTDGVGTFTPTVDCCDLWIRLSGSGTEFDFSTTVQIEESATATPYQAYWVGDTATAQNLFGSNDFKDVQNVKTGAVTRYFRLQVLDGSEDWTESATTYVYNIIFDGKYVGKREMFCTHFQYSTATSANLTNGKFSCGANSLSTFFRNESCANLTEWKNWLTAQYNNGTPVIVVYPLATATTEHVTGQTLHLKSGTNIIEITQASIDGLALEAKYKGITE